MTRSASRRARPTIAPDTPPAIAAVLELGAGLVVCVAVWPVAIATGVLSVATVFEAAESCAIYVLGLTPSGVSALLVGTRNGVDGSMVSEVKEAAAPVRLGVTS